MSANAVILKATIFPSTSSVLNGWDFRITCTSPGNLQEGTASAFGDGMRAELLKLFLEEGTASWRAAETLRLWLRLGSDWTSECISSREGLALNTAIDVMLAEELRRSQEWKGFDARANADELRKSQK